MPELSPETLLNGYAEGIFPMADAAGKIDWYEADPRAILDVETFHLPHEVRRDLKKNRFHIRFDTAFEPVMRHCAARPETWISEEMIRVYTALHQLGHAHSVEAWRSDRLVGGLYGVCIGGAFFGESMFYRAPGASKAALARLCEHLRARRFALHDVQQMTPTLALFGARLIPKAEYHQRLAEAITMEKSFVADEK